MGFSSPPITIASITLLTLSVFHGGFISRADANSYELLERTKLIELNSKLLELIDDQLEQENQRIATLNQLKSYTINNLDSTRKLNETASLNDLHPIDAFVILHRSLQNLMRAEDLTDLSSSTQEFSVLQNLEDFLGHNVTGLEEHLVKRGEALLRVQKFYDLDPELLLQGRIQEHSNFTTSLTRLDGEDCFLLGRIAYDNRQFDLSVVWLKIALSYTNCSDASSIRGFACPSSSKEDASLILDYLAYASYRNNDTRNAIYYTLLWLQYDPTNDRALENLRNYDTEMSIGQVDPFDEDEEEHQPDWLTKQMTEERRLLGYEPGEDSQLRKSCLTKQVLNSNRGRCFSRLSIQTNTMYPEIRYEILNEEPEIVRVYDVISRQEIQALLRLALPHLRPSTIGKDPIGIIAKYRVALTAWLAASEHPLVKNIEQRLYHIFGFSDITGCEPLQLVKYKFGGHYGPHYDASRAIDPYSETLYPHDDNDRAATILIYLSDVDEGGSTVFPTLNLTVEPIKASAVAWFNLNHLGYTEPHSIHAACPVFIGTKWIATKWPTIRSVLPSGLCTLDPSVSRYSFAPFLIK